MSHEFDFIDLYYLNDLSSTKSISSDISLEEDILAMKSAMDVIKISDIETDDTDVTVTCAKFLEILDAEGLEGLVNL